MKNKNTGLILEQPWSGDWYLSGETDFEIVNPSANWEDYLPDFESQAIRIKTGSGYTIYDTMGCVSFSALNVNETLFKARWGAEPNWSDRWLAKISGTDPNRGNTLNRVAETIRINGLISQSSWPNAASSKSQFYKHIPFEVTHRRTDFLKNWEINHWWIGYGSEIDPNRLKEGLKFSPLQVTMAIGKKKDGVYQRTEASHHHAVMLFKIDDDGFMYIFDHYKKNKIRKLAPNYKLGWAKAFRIKEKKVKLVHPARRPEGRIVYTDGIFNKAGKAIVNHLVEKRGYFMYPPQYHF